MFLLLRLRVLLLLLNLYGAAITNAQNETIKDSAIIINHEVLSKKKEKERLNFRSFFRDRNDEATTQIKGYKKLNLLSYSELENKIIRQVIIKVLDPFDYSIEGESEEIISRQSKWYNKMHLRSRESVIKNLLQFHEGSEFDSLLIKESERLIRKQSFIRDAATVILINPKSTDSVDILFYVLDFWTITPDLSWTDHFITTGLGDINLFGIGHALTTEQHWYHSNGGIGLNFRYLISNLGNTFITADFKYGYDEFKNFTKSIEMDRSFFSPLTKWAGGISISQKKRQDPTFVNTDFPELKTYNLIEKDFWAGYAFRLNNITDTKATSLITSARYYNINYLEKSTESFDSLQIFENEKFILSSIGVATRKFTRDKFIYEYGITEDVPTGGLIALTAGFQDKNDIGRYYLSTRMLFGKYYSWGYFSAQFRYGSFIRQSKPEQGTLDFGLNYFTGLIKLKNWNFRQFIKTNTTVGINRLEYERLTLNEFYAPEINKSPNFIGDKRILITFHSQFYSPYKLYGFRFAPFFVYSAAIVENQRQNSTGSTIYSQFGFGVLVNNLNLVFNTFQLSVSFYPLLTDGGRYGFRYNPFKIADFGFDNFEIGKPSTTLFK
ncbi:MAG: hypothetical protein IPM42_01180 [Saprospiraceae bacterium]|nr:hypothetical protein [Saprospiraceae bacterium]